LLTSFFYPSSLNNDLHVHCHVIHNRKDTEINLDEWTKKQLAHACTHTHRGILSYYATLEKEILPFFAIQMDLEDIVKGTGRPRKEQ
jgi:hypothetical protein